MSPKQNGATRWFVQNVEQLRRDVADLSLVQRGAYEALRMYYFERREPLPNNREVLFRLAGASGRTERMAVDAVLERKFELLDDGLWHNALCDGELANIREREAKRSESGRVAAHARWDANRMRSAYQAQCDSNASGCSKGVKELSGEEDTSLINVPKNYSRKATSESNSSPAPPKNTNKVGADISAQSTLAQFQDESPPPLTPASDDDRSTDPALVDFIAQHPQLAQLPQWQQRGTHNRWRRKHDPNWGNAPAEDDYAAWLLRQKQAAGELFERD